MTLDTTIVHNKHAFSTHTSERGIARKRRLRIQLDSPVSKRRKEEAPLDLDSPVRKRRREEPILEGTWPTSLRTLTFPCFFLQVAIRNHIKCFSSCSEKNIGSILFQ